VCVCDVVAWCLVDVLIDVCRLVKSTTAAGAADGGAGCHGDGEDEDVAQERRRVLRGSGRHDLLQLRNLSKVSDHLSKMSRHHSLPLLL